MLVLSRKRDERIVIGDNIVITIEAKSVQVTTERVWNDPRLPMWSGELYLEYHRGTYTSQSRTKQANRASELLYREAEWLNAWATALVLADAASMATSHAT